MCSRAKDSMSKMRNIALLFILSPAILSGCAQEQYVWKKSGANQNDYNRDLYECESEAARTYPAAMGTQKFGSGYTTPLSVTCYGGACTSYGGQHMDAPTMSVDRNQENRTRAAELCMRARGWQSVSVSQIQSQSQIDQHHQKNIADRKKVEDAFQRGLAAYSNKDYETALREWRPLAEEGLPVAQNNLGQMYANGQGVPKDDNEAAKWTRMAAEKGDTEARYNLGIMLTKGEGLQKDEVEGAKWIRMAAENNGHAEAQGYLGWMYSNGVGVPKDYAEAMKWFRRAAEQGSAEAQAALGVCYAGGHGVTPDNVQSYMWVNIAASNGFDKAKRILDELAAKMTPQQIQEAKTLSDQWINSHRK